MINIFILLIQLILLYFFYRVYFNFIIEYINLFYINEIKNFLFNKFNLKVNLAIENKIIDQNLQQQSYSINDINDKEYSYNKKEKILITIGFIITAICIYIFFKNNTILNDTSFDSKEVISNQNLIIDLDLTKEIINDDHLDILPIFLNEALQIDKKLVELLKADVLDLSSIHVCLKIDISYSFQNNLGLDPKDATEQTEKLFMQHIDVVDKFIMKKSIFLKKK